MVQKQWSSLTGICSKDDRGLCQSLNYNAEESKKLI